MAPAIPVNFVGQKEPKKLFASEMGKARKYSKGKSPGFVPNYRHSVEKMAQSVGFGCPGGIDPEMTLSEDSRAPKRKRITLNGDGDGDGYNSCGVRKEVLPLSKMSRFERKDLICRLKMDLERVQDLYKKLASVNSDIVLLSPHSDIHSCRDGPKRLPPESCGRSVGSHSQGKKRGPLHTNMPRSKKGPCGRSESASLDAPTRFSVAIVMKQCETLLNRLMSHQYGWPFLSPVDPVKLNVPDYFTIIKRPMDLGTVKSRLNKGEYSSPSDFAEDVRLTFSNAMIYNPPGNEYHFMAQSLSKCFETRWRIIEKKVPVIERSILPLNDPACLNSEIHAELSMSKTKAAAVNQSKLRVEPTKLIMTDDDKKKIKRELEALEDEIPESIVDFLRDQSAGHGQSSEEEIEIDIDVLSDEILFKLRKLLDDYIIEKKKFQENSKPCEMEIVHDLGLSTSPAQQSKDSDSSSSSGSESDTVKASYPTSAKDKEDPGVAVKGEESSGNIKETVNDLLNESNQLGQEFDDKQTATVVDRPLFEETAPSERQISPEKLYRRALLKNRFADTILKAREKALDKGEKGDPEKLRIEREELERRLREEKARLQAEAKAAEEAKRKAEAEAAAKARRKREQERKAARLALQKMERTVDINENCQFLGDLKMLRAVAEGDQLPSCIEETSPEYSENMFGSFKMQGNNNPLEQLGLYMRMDEDDDEEEDAQPPVSQNKADDQPVNQIKSDEQSVEQNEGEMRSLVINREEEEQHGHSLSRGEEDQPSNQNEVDGKPVEQNKEEALSLVLNREEEDGYFLSESQDGQPLNQKERDEQPLNGSQGGERVQDWNEGGEQLESARPEQANDAEVQANDAVG